MPAYTETLTRLRRQEQEARGYATSSRWYTGLSNAISFLDISKLRGFAPGSREVTWPDLSRRWCIIGASTSG